ARLPAKSDERQDLSASRRKFSQPAINNRRVLHGGAQALRQIVDRPVPTALEQARGYLPDKHFVISRQRRIQAVQPWVGCDHVVLGNGHESKIDRTYRSNGSYQDFALSQLITHHSLPWACVPSSAIRPRRHPRGRGGLAGLDR